MNGRTIRRWACGGAAFTIVVSGMVAAGAVASGTPGAGRGGLQTAVNKVHAAGAVGVLAHVKTGADDSAARAGVADTATGRPMPWNAYYRIGSTTKTFTAVVALQLAGEGKLRLSDSVERWLPGLVRGNGNDGSRITVENLLRQTSGLNDYDEQLPWAKRFTPETFRRERFHAYRPEELVAMATKKPPQWIPSSAAETRWAYSNTNYVLVNMIIQRVTGHSPAQEINDRVVEPLGLGRTIAAGTSAYVPQPRANAYTWFPGRAEPTETSLFAPLPDAPLISTTSDVNAFFRALMGGRLLHPAQLAQMKKTVEADEAGDAGSGARYGLGISWRPVSGCPGGVWSHGGTMPGHVSEAAVTGDGRRAVAVSTNTWRPGDERQDDQDKAVTELVDRALCGSR
ncbi:serine hydrolase domain-containing protein [Actinomadura luteofluorescens]|uniref:serine hydrolase domain-containing protein n=1 Tax=Actinomadura luteofluorescens TaxID=46163 RepID=UPI003D8D693D